MVSLCCGAKHKINAIKIQNGRMKCVKFWNHKCDNESDSVRLSVQVRELSEWIDKCNSTFIDKVEHQNIIDL